MSCLRELQHRVMILFVALVIILPRQCVSALIFVSPVTQYINLFLLPLPAMLFFGHNCL
jgi:hypothetical protein